MNWEAWAVSRQAVWRELRTAVDQIYRRGAKRAGPQHVQQLLRLYREAAADLARLRSMDADATAVTNLNRLVSRAHGLIYQGRIRRHWNLLRFLFIEHPRLFRRTAIYTAVSFALCFTVYVMAYQVVQDNPAIVADILGGMDQEFSGEKDASDITDRFQAVRQQVLAAAVTTNNIKVALFAFALGITFGIGTVYVLIVNSAMLGGIAGAFARSDIESTLWMTILPHGALELSAIVLAGASGMMIGWALWSPGDRTRVQALREHTRTAVLLTVGLVPAFIVAGVFEGFVTPSNAIPQGVKVTMGVAVAILFWLHLFVSGRRPDADESAA